MLETLRPFVTPGSFTATLALWIAYMGFRAARARVRG